MPTLKAIKPSSSSSDSVRSHSNPKSSDNIYMDALNAQLPPEANISDKIAYYTHVMTAANFFEVEPLIDACASQLVDYFTHPDQLQKFARTPQELVQTEWDKLDLSEDLERKVITSMLHNVKYMIPPSCKLNYQKYSIDAIDLSHDNSMVAFANTDEEKNINTIRICNAKTGKLKHTLKVNGRGISTLKFSPNGAMLALGKFCKKDIFIWRPQTNSNLSTLSGHTDNVASLTFSPDGKKLASSGWDGNIIIWSLETGQQQLSLNSGTNVTYLLKFSPNGKKLAFGSSDNKIIVWDLKADQQQHSLSGHTKGATVLVFSPDNTTLVSAETCRAKMNIWNHETGKMLGSFDFVKNYTKNIHAIAHSKDGTILAANYRGERVIIWHPETTGKERHVLVGHVNHHCIDGWVATFAFGSDGTTLASGSDNGEVIIWDLESYKKDMHNTSIDQAFWMHLQQHLAQYYPHSLGFSEKDQKKFMKGANKNELAAIAKTINPTLVEHFKACQYIKLES